MPVIALCSIFISQPCFYIVLDAGVEVPVTLPRCTLVHMGSRRQAEKGLRKSAMQRLEASAGIPAVRFRPIPGVVRIALRRA